MKFYSSVRIDVRRREVMKDNEGISVRTKVVKNKVAPPFRIAEFDVLFGSGIDYFGCLLDGAEVCGVVERSGSWYSKGDLRIAQGRRSAIEYLKSNPLLTTEIENEVRIAIRKKLSRQEEGNADFIESNALLLEDVTTISADMQVELTDIEKQNPVSE